jgi:hypothetical protein
MPLRRACWRRFRLFTFRGDSDEAWNRAEAFMSRDLRAALAAH